MSRAAALIYGAAAVVSPEIEINTRSLSRDAHLNCRELTVIADDLVSNRERQQVVIPRKSIHCTCPVRVHIDRPFWSELRIRVSLSSALLQGMGPDSIHCNIRIGQVKPDVDALGCECLHATIVALGAVDCVDAYCIDPKTLH